MTHCAEINRTNLPSWKALSALAQSMKNQHMNDLFAMDAQRFENFSINLPNILFDYSKNLIDDSVMAELLQLTKEVKLADWRDKMFNAERINLTENRAVLHTALRNRKQKEIIFDGENVTEQVEQALAHMETFVNQVPCQGQ